MDFVDGQRPRRSPHGEYGRLGRELRAPARYGGAVERDLEYWLGCFERVHRGEGQALRTQHTGDLGAPLVLALKGDARCVYRERPGGMAGHVRLSLQYELRWTGQGHIDRRIVQLEVIARRLEDGLAARFDLRRDIRVRHPEGRLEIEGKAWDEATSAQREVVDAILAIHLAIDVAHAGVGDAQRADAEGERVAARSLRRVSARAAQQVLPVCTLRTAFEGEGEAFDLEAADLDPAAQEGQHAQLRRRAREASEGLALEARRLRQARGADLEADGKIGERQVALDDQLTAGILERERGDLVAEVVRVESEREPCAGGDHDAREDGERNEQRFDESLHRRAHGAAQCRDRR